jgi:hypothetical protein
MPKVSATRVFVVMPAEAGIQLVTVLNESNYLDTGFRRCDESFLD